jgi:hypothetical protein
MTFIQDVYYSSEFKKSYEYNYNFNIPLDINIDVRGSDKIKFKLVDFSMMNSMLNVSAFHKNNQFNIKYLSLDNFITIPDGSYTAPNLKDVINSILTTLSIPVIFDYDKKTNKFKIQSNVNLQFYPLNCSLLLGFIQPSYSFLVLNSYTSETFANMLPYNKIVLTTDLSFDTNTQNNFQLRYSANSGIGNIICWIPRDIPIFSTINYSNNDEIEIADKNIKSINFSIINEYQEYILDCPNVFLHFQLITFDNTNWHKRFYNILNDIAYYLLSTYFKKA